MSGQTGRLLAIIERGEPIPEVSRRDMRLIADTLAAQARQLRSQARSKTLAGAANTDTGAALRARAARLADLAAELGPHHSLLLSGRSPGAQPVNRPNHRLREPAPRAGPGVPADHRPRRLACTCQPRQGPSPARA